MSVPSFAELEAAASCVIRLLKTMPEFSDSKIAVIGGLGVWKYLRGYRTTKVSLTPENSMGANIKFGIKDVDFLITVQEAPRAVKDKLLAMPSSPFVQPAEIFLYKAPNGRQIQIDMTPGWLSPYLPSAATPISAVQPSSLPYISEIDLLVFKINSCGLRATKHQKENDANDAMFLADYLSSKGPIVLSSMQKDTVIQGLKDVAEHSAKDMNWWKITLGLN